MKIAVWHNLPSGGGKRALHDHVAGLVRRGHHVECWSPDTAVLGYMPLSPYAVEHAVPLRSVTADGRGRIGRRLKPLRDLKSMIAGMESHSRRCAEEIEAGDFDLLFANSCGVFAAPFIGRYTSLPSVLYLQEPCRPFYEALLTPDRNRLMWVPGPSKHAPGRSLRQRQRDASDFAETLLYTYTFGVQAREENRNVRAFDQVLCNSLFSRETFLRVYGRDTRVCYLGIDTDEFPPSPEAKGRYVIGLGKFGANKGIDLAVRALASIPADRRPDLVWVGDSASTSYLEEITTLALRSGVNFLPRRMVSQAELVDLLGRAAVMLYTSRLEPFGYAPLEANACGTVVVGVAEGGVRETVRDGENGTLVDGDDAEALGRAVLRYVDDPEAANLEGARARQHVLARWRVEDANDRLEAELVRALRPAPADAPAPAHAVSN